MLVIIGLIVGGVLVGRDLIRAAEFRKIARDAEQYITATHTFRLKYGKLPGDINNASMFWGANCDVGATIGCNGNNDGQVMRSNTGSEYTMYWRHLRLSGLIAFDASGSHYSGFSGRGGDNIPFTGLKAAFYVGGLKQAARGTETFRNMLSIARFDDSYPSLVSLSNVPWTTGQYWTNIEAQAFDEKFDDGHASSGQIWAVPGNTAITHCKASAVADYTMNLGRAVNGTAQGCQITYVNPF